MSDTPVDTSKRTWLIASGCAGAAGGVAVAVPFVSSFQPSEKAKAAGAAVEVDISALQPGEKLTVEWRGKPVWILKRTPEQIASLAKTEPQLADPKSDRKTYPTPEYAKNNTAPSSLKSSWAWAFAPTWVARPAISSKRALSLLCLTTGMAASCVLATAPLSTWLAACSRTSLRLTTWKSRPTCICPIRVC